MTKSILIELRASIFVDGQDCIKSRINDYCKGLKSFFDKVDTKECDVVFVENTCENEDSVPQEIMHFIPEGTFLYVKEKNDYGKYNKGGGDIDMWKDYIEQISEYDYFFHYEPRMILDDPSFIQSFLDNPRNLFCYEDNPHVSTVKTGYFGVRVSDFKEYVDSINLDKFVNFEGGGIAIESSMRNFWETKDTNFQPDIKYCTRRWYDKNYGSGYSKY